jgi:formyltetrahydrofolate-dependent phosphoribosylglycinamide formyltransferase
MSRIAVLASGAGSNLQAILGYLAAAGPSAAGTVSLVASDKLQAGALAIGTRAGIPSATIADPNDARSILALLDDHQIGLVALAGYLKHVPEPVTRRYRGRIVNVHPALLPAFGGPGMYGTRVHRAVLDAGVRITGVTVHFVDEAYDHGPIIAQWPVPVLAGDTPAVLAARVLRAEHRLYPCAVAAVASGRVSLDAGGTVIGETGIPVASPVFRLQTEESEL